MIKHLRHDKIDMDKWDLAIEQAHNSLPYAYSWYLDTVSPGWEALVKDDYVAVMPLPKKSKFYIPYLIQPRFCQQLGIFSSEAIDTKLIKAFLAAIPYHAYELQLNSANACTMEAYCNYIMLLNKSRERLLEGYSKNTLRNIEKAKAANLEINTIGLEDFMYFWAAQNTNKSIDLSDTLQRIAQAGLPKGIVKLYGVWTVSEKRLIAVLLTIETEKRIIYLAPASNQDGLKASAMFLLVDHLLNREANSGKVFDFEGSRIGGVARFYEGFGVENHPYFVIRKNRPSWLVKLLNP